jgi:SDR family mycofactocin-dependent oxidoreductase
MGKLEGKVAFVTGAARGQGRSHAVRLAEEGADIIAVDLCGQLDSVEYDMAGPDDLQQTVKLVEDCGRTIVATLADVRNREALEAALAEGLQALGHVDIVLANAGIMPVTGDQGRSLGAWTDAIDVMLTGVFHTVEVTRPHLVSQGTGGSIILTGSTAATKAMTKTLDTTTPGLLGYTAAKHGVLGLMKSYANALAPHSIRVNAVSPTGCNTPMVANEAFGRWIGENPEMVGNLQNLLPVEMVEALDVSNAIAWLASDEARYVTGVNLPVDAGFIIR